MTPSVDDLSVDSLATCLPTVLPANESDFVLPDKISANLAEPNSRSGALSSVKSPFSTENSAVVVAVFDSVSAADTCVAPTRNCE